MRQSLREQLGLLRILVCEKCRYDQRGSIESARCPECGTPFVPPNLPGDTPAEAPKHCSQSSGTPLDPSKLPGGTPAEAPEKGREGAAEPGR